MKRARILLCVIVWLAVAAGHADAAVLYRCASAERPVTDGPFHFSPVVDAIAARPDVH